MRLWVEPTNVCSEKCSFCLRRDMTRKEGFMSFETFEKLVADGLTVGLDNISFTGWGETLLHKKLPLFIRFASQHGIFTSVPTNAKFLSPEKGRELVAAGLNRIRFSVRDAVANTSLDTVKQIACFCEAYPHVESVAVVVVNESNVSSLDDFKSWLQIVDSLVFQRETRLDGVRSHPCSVLGRTFYVWWNGDVSPCCVDVNGELCLGNVKNDAVGSIMCNVRLEALKKQHETMQGLPQICSRCVEFEGGSLPYRFV